MQIYYDRDANPNVLRDKKIAVIGYGSQGFAQSNNLHESGCNVTVGLRHDSTSIAKAEQSGLPVLPVAQAAAEADIVMMLVPDEIAPDVYARDIAESMTPGKFLAFSHGFSIHYGFIKPPADVSIFMVAPKGPGHLVRHEYKRGAGVPSLLAVHQDPTGDTKQIGLAYASAIGAGRAGIIETSFREETETDLFGEQAVLGDMTRGPTVVNDESKRRMKSLLAEVQSGAFANEWMKENRNGKKRFRQLEEETKQHQIERVGAQLREMMPWLAEGRLVDKAKN